VRLELGLVGLMLCCAELGLGLGLELKARR